MFNEYHSTVFSKEPQEEKRETNESTKPWAFLGRAIDAMSGSVSPAVFNEYHEEGSPAGDEGGLASLWERAVDALAERSSGSISVNYSPNVTIQGNADQSTVERALSISRRELERMLAEISTDRRRLSYE